MREGRDGGDGRAAPRPPLPSVSVTALDAALIEMLRNGNHGSTREVASPPASPSSFAPEHILERPFQSLHRGDQTVSVVSLNQVVDLSTHCTRVSGHKGHVTFVALDWCGNYPSTHLTTLSIGQKAATCVVRGRAAPAIGSPVRIEIDFISSMIEIPRSRPRNADRTKHGGEGEIDLTSRTDGAERFGVGATRDESDALLLRVWADVSGNRITASAADGRTGRCATAVAAVAEAALAARRLKPRKADD